MNRLHNSKFNTPGTCSPPFIYFLEASSLILYPLRISVVSKCPLSKAQVKYPCSTVYIYKRPTQSEFRTRDCRSNVLNACNLHVVTKRTSPILKLAKYAAQCPRTSIYYSHPFWPPLADPTYCLFEVKRVPVLVMDHCVWADTPNVMPVEVENVRNESHDGADRPENAQCIVNSNAGINRAPCHSNST